MDVKQVYNFVNGVTNEILGKSDLLNEDLSNIVDVGKEIFDATSVDNYVRTLVDHIAKVVFVNRPYSGKVPSVLMDSWDYGAVVEKITADLPTASENESWELEDGHTYNPNIFYKPTVSAKFFSNRVTFEIDMSFTELQIRSAFNSAREVNSFISMIMNAVEKSFTIKIDGLIMRSINAFMGEVLANNNANTAVNLLAMFNAKFNSGTDATPLLAADAIYNPDFIRYASMIMALYIERLSRISTLYNIGGKDRFTSADMLHVVMLSDFKAAANSYLQSDTFHNEFTALPNAETVPYWQGTGTNYDFNSISTINIKLASDNETTVNQSGIICVMFDRDALGVSNLERRVTTNYNPKAEFYTNFYKMEMGSFVDTNENGVVFYIADGE
jgi:hypothetical protein